MTYARHGPGHLSMPFYRQPIQIQQKTRWHTSIKEKQSKTKSTLPHGSKQARWGGASGIDRQVLVNSHFQTKTIQILCAQSAQPGDLRTARNPGKRSKLELEIEGKGVKPRTCKWSGPAFRAGWGTGPARSDHPPLGGQVHQQRCAGIGHVVGGTSRAAWALLEWLRSDLW